MFQSFFFFFSFCDSIPIIGITACQMNFAAAPKDTIAAGDLVVVYGGHASIQAIVVKPGLVTNNKFGSFHHIDMVGRSFGSRLTPRYADREGSHAWLLAPTAEMWTLALPHRTQILYAADIATICCKLDLRPGAVVVESGTGSASLSHAMARTIAPTGHLHTFEFHAKRAAMAKEEFTDHGLADVVTVTNADAIKDGFGGLSGVADAVFLDLPAPWLALPEATRALKDVGRLCTFSPCIEQVQRSCAALAALGYTNIETIEVLRRPFEVNSGCDATIPHAFVQAGLVGDDQDRLRGVPTDGETETVPSDDGAVASQAEITASDLDATDGANDETGPESSATGATKSEKKRKRGGGDGADNGDGGGDGDEQGDGDEPAYERPLRKRRWKKRQVYSGRPYTEAHSFPKIPGHTGYLTFADLFKHARLNDRPSASAVAAVADDP